MASTAPIWSPTPAIRPSPISSRERYRCAGRVRGSRHRDGGQLRVARRQRDIGTDDIVILQQQLAGLNAIREGVDLRRSWRQWRRGSGTGGPVDGALIPYP